MKRHSMHDKLYGSIKLFMKCDENMGSLELEKVFVLAGATELQADELIGTLGSFRDMVLNLYHEFSFPDLQNVVRKRNLIRTLLVNAFEDDLGVTEASS